MRFAACQRLRKQYEFTEVRQKGKRIDARYFIFQVLKRTVGPRRLGIIASKKVGNAVVRNRAKRLFREIFRKNQETLPPHCDLVVVARSAYRNATFQELELAFNKAASKINAQC